MASVKSSDSKHLGISDKRKILKRPVTRSEMVAQAVVFFDVTRDKIDQKIGSNSVLEFMHEKGDM
jgi:hypothetical protein